MVLIIVMMMATLLLIGLAAVLPSVYQEGQREREEELVFRGYEYGRAVARFHQQFNRYPVSVKELLQTNGIRFLRKEYLDPMDPKGKWRFIHVNAAGVLLDSKNQPLNGNRSNGNPAGLGQNSSTSSGFGGSSFGSSSFGSSSFGSSSFGGSSLSSGSSSMGFQGSSTGTNSAMGFSGQTGSSSSSFGSSNDIQGAFIAGVAATSHHESIRVWQKHRHYDEWEFLGIDMGIFGVQVGMGGSSVGPTGMGSTPLGSSFSPGSSQGSSFGSTPTPPNSATPSN
jgi:hypothetical protein